jgi:hypothetical protein
MPETPKIDVVIIGAPKAGTTSLFEYLRTHPELHLPKWKETNFFLDTWYSRGVNWYFDWILTGAPPGAVCGEASVRYMAGTARNADAGEPPAGAATMEEDLAPEEVVPSRIRAALPNAKLIAVLRDPVDRCVSEYGMAALRGTETRDLETAVADLLRTDQLVQARACYSETNLYVVQSEYGRILAPYFEMFPRENLLVLYTRELADDAGAVMRRVFSFLGVAEDFTPPNLGTRYLEGAARPRSRALDLPRLTRYLRRRKGLLSTWERVPIRIRQQFWASAFLVEKWNRAPASGDPRPIASPEVQNILRAHFRDDRERLVALTGAEPPWE